MIQTEDNRFFKTFLWLAIFLSAPSVQAFGQVAVISGTVHSSKDLAPVEFAYIHLEEVRRTALTDIDGNFLMKGIPIGHHTIHVTRIGFEPLRQVIEVMQTDTLLLNLTMNLESIQTGEITIEGEREVGSGLGVEHKMEGEKLRQHLGTTIAETMKSEPGIAMRSMGPAPARPVMRGLGGERLLVLENGGRTGDLSQTSSDHALVIDPLNADRLEILRGPPALVFGSNALGGAINVVSETILSSVPEQVHASVSMQGQSVSRGLAGGAGLSLPIGSNWALRMSASHRQGSDVNTPDGRLKNTELQTSTGTAGLSRVWKKGFIGVSGTLYDSGYGIPGGFIGAHPNGVSVEAFRVHGEVRMEYLPSFNWLRRLEAVGSWTRYDHQEYESSGILGIEYGLLTWESRIISHTGHIGPFEHGAFGVHLEFRDFAAGGFSFTPATSEQTVAVFGFQDFHVGENSVQLGVRYDVRTVNPSESFESDIGTIRKRNFGNISASISVKRTLSNGISTSAMVMRSIRLPGIEELFSEGPHLAAYSFEVGNPDLPNEVGTGAEISMQVEKERTSGSVTLFHNRFKDYIFPLNTGDLNYRIYVPIYQFTGTDAQMTGAEGRLERRIGDNWSTSATGSWVRGTLSELDSPIPWMPPLRGSVDVTWKNQHWEVTASIRGATTQNRLGPFEEKTIGYVVPDVSVQHHRIAFGMLQTISIGIDNLTNTSYREHLSRVKSIMPEPGRNLRLLYRAYF